MVKLRLKRCGRKQRATWRTWSAVDFFSIHHFILSRNEWALGSTSFVRFYYNPLFLLGCNVNSTWWSSSRKYLFISQGQGSRVNTNQYVGTNFVSIFLISKSKGSDSNNFSMQKENPFELVKLFRSKVYHAGINCSYDSFIERNHKKGFVAAIF